VQVETYSIPEYSSPDEGAVGRSQVWFRPSYTPSSCNTLQLEEKETQGEGWRAANEELEALDSGSNPDSVPQR
jgi:hypothetical protein